MNRRRNRRMDRLTDEASPEAVAAVAAPLGCRSVALTRSDPAVFHVIRRRGYTLTAWNPCPAGRSRLA